MKLDLDELKDLFKYLKDSDELKETTDFYDFTEYIVGLIIDNVEYDYNIIFSDYVDLNRFIIEE